MRGPRLLLAAVTSLAVAGTVLAVPAQAAACEQGGGVTVVVDFASLGGGVQTDCAPGDPGSGVESLRGAGHEPTRAAQQAGYFLCRIDGKPANDPCQRASPANAYWSYWHAEPGGSWTYSNTGPAERDPAPGTVEGWAFGAGDPPSVAPPRERSAEPAPKPAPTSSPTRAPKSPSKVAAPVAPEPAQSSPAGMPPTTSRPAAASAAPSASGNASTTTSTAPSVSPSSSPSLSAGPVAVDRPAEGDDGASSLAGPLAALGVLLLLGAGGAYQVQQRRSRDAAI